MSEERETIHCLELMSMENMNGCPFNKLIRELEILLLVLELLILLQKLMVKVRNGDSLVSNQRTEKNGVFLILQICILKQPQLPFTILLVQMLLNLSLIKQV